VLLRYAKAKITRIASWDEIFIRDRKVRTASILEDKALDRTIQIKPIALNPQKYLYVQARAVSGGEVHGPNDNGDYFRWEELQERYMTFIGAAVNIDHKNNAPEWACGIIIDAQLNPEQWVEIVMAIDKAKAEKLYPGVIKKIEAGAITDVSMGCLVEWSICSTCLRTKADGDESKLVQGQGLAMEPEDYCEHVDEDSPAFCKGMPDPDGEICHEDNRGVTFFEESIITTQGADPDAKLGQRFASVKINEKIRIASFAPPQHTPSDKSALAPYINFRSLDNVRLAHLKRISKGEDSMGAEKKPVVAAGPGNPTDTEQDRGDYGKASEKDKALFDQSKQKSQKEDEKRGNEVETMIDRGDYTLAALAAVQVLRKAGKADPKLIASLLPLIASEEEVEKPGEKKADEVDMHKDKAKPGEEEGVEEVPEKKEVGEKPGMVEKGEEEYVEPTAATAAKKDVKLSGKDSKFAQAKAVLADAMSKIGAILGNPLETAKDAGDYDAGDVNKETKSVADSNAGATEKEKKAQDAAGNSTKEDREKQVELAKRAAAKQRKADNEDKKVDFITSEMMKGKNFDDSKQEADERYKEDETRQAAAEPEMKDGTDKTQKSPATEDKAEGENKMQDKELDQEKAGSSVEKPEVEREIAAGKKVKAESTEEEMQKGTEETKDSKKEAAAEEAPESKEEKEVEGAKEEKSEKPEEVVGKLDTAAAAFEDEEKKLKEEAANLASLGLKEEAKLIVKRISSLQEKVAVLNSLANKIEDNGKRVASVANIAQRKKALGQFSIMVKKASVILAEVCKGDDEEKKTVESSMQKSASAKRLASENAQLKASQLKQQAAIQRIARSQAVSSLIKMAKEKGLIDETQVASTIERWSKLSDPAFAEIKAHFAAAKPVRVAGVQGLRKNLREAAAGLTRVANGELEGVEAPVAGLMKQSDLDEQLADMFMDDARAMGSKGPRGSF